MASLGALTNMKAFSHLSDFLGSFQTAQHLFTPLMKNHMSSDVGTSNRYVEYLVGKI